MAQSWAPLVLLRDTLSGPDWDELTAHTCGDLERGDCRKLRMAADLVVAQ